MLNVSAPASVPWKSLRRPAPRPVWAYVLMPDHVHLVVNPGYAPEQMSRFLQAVKEPVARRAIAYLKVNAPHWLRRLTVQEGGRVRHRFWQPGGGYDRIVTTRRCPSLQWAGELLHSPAAPLSPSTSSTYSILTSTWPQAARGVAKTTPGVPSNTPIST